MTYGPTFSIFVSLCVRSGFGHCTLHLSHPLILQVAREQWQILHPLTSHLNIGPFYGSHTDLMQTRYGWEHELAMDGFPADSDSFGRHATACKSVTSWHK